MFIMALRVATAFAVIGVCATALAQLIPPSAMPGRERERFIDPLPPPRAQPGPMFSPPGAIYAPRSAKRKTHKAYAPKK
jgi:hypothetical protein